MLLCIKKKQNEISSSSQSEGTLIHLTFHLSSSLETKYLPGAEALESMRNPIVALRGVEKQHFK
jgi:hypothetical protein